MARWFSAGGREAVEGPTVAALALARNTRPRLCAAPDAVIQANFDLVRRALDALPTRRAHPPGGSPQAASRSCMMSVSTPHSFSHEPKRQRPLGTKNCKRVRTPGTQLWAACQGAARDGGRAEQRGLPE